MSCTAHIRVSSEKEKSFRENFAFFAKILLRFRISFAKNAKIFLRNVSFPGNPSTHTDYTRLNGTLHQINQSLPGKLKWPNILSISDFKFCSVKRTVKVFYFLFLGLILCLLSYGGLDPSLDLVSFLYNGTHLLQCYQLLSHTLSYFSNPSNKEMKSGTFKICVKHLELFSKFSTMSDSQ